MGRKQNNLRHLSCRASLKPKLGQASVSRVPTVVKETTWEDAGFLLGLWSASTPIPPSVGAISCPGSLSKKETKGWDLPPLCQGPNMWETPYLRGTRNCPAKQKERLYNRNHKEKVSYKGISTHFHLQQDSTWWKLFHELSKTVCER